MLVIVVVIWALTGGFVIVETPEDNYRVIENDFAPYVRVEVLSNDCAFGIPFVFQVITPCSPSTIRVVYITHTIVDDPKVRIDELAVDYAEGRSIDLTKRINANQIPIIEEHMFIDDAHNQQSKRSLRSVLTATDCLPSKDHFSFRASGRLFSRDNVVEPFQYKFDFPQRHKKTIFFTWYWLVVSKA